MFPSTAEFPGAAKKQGHTEGLEDGVLKGLKLAVSCLFSSEDQKFATALLQDHAGIYHYIDMIYTNVRMVWCDCIGRVVEVKEASYLLSPLEVADRTAPERVVELSSLATPVTMIWLVRWRKLSSPYPLPPPYKCPIIPAQQRSIEAGAVLEPSSNFLFQPLAKKMVDTTLNGCVLAFRL